MPLTIKSVLRVIHLAFCVRACQSSTWKFPLTAIRLQKLHCTWYLNPAGATGVNQSQMDAVSISNCRGMQSSLGLVGGAPQSPGYLLKLCFPLKFDLNQVLGSSAVGKAIIRGIIGGSQLPEVTSICIDNNEMLGNLLVREPNNRQSWVSLWTIITGNISCFPSENASSFVQGQGYKSRV